MTTIKPIKTDKNNNPIYYTDVAEIYGPSIRAADKPFNAKNAQLTLGKLSNQKKGVKVNLQAFATEIVLKKKGLFGKKPKTNRFSYKMVKNFYQFGVNPKMVILALEGKGVESQYLGIAGSTDAKTNSLISFLQASQWVDLNNFKGTIDTAKLLKQDDELNKDYTKSNPSVSRRSVSRNSSSSSSKRKNSLPRSQLLPADSQSQSHVRPATTSSSSSPSPSRPIPPPPPKVPNRESDSPALSHHSSRRESYPASKNEHSRHRNSISRTLSALSSISGSVKITNEGSSKAKPSPVTHHKVQKRDLSSSSSSSAHSRSSPSPSKKEEKRVAKVNTTNQSLIISCSPEMGPLHPSKIDQIKILPIQDSSSTSSSSSLLVYSPKHRCPSRKDGQKEKDLTRGNSDSSTSSSSDSGQRLQSASSRPKSSILDNSSNGGGVFFITTDPNDILRNIPVPGKSSNKEIHKIAADGNNTPKSPIKIYRTCSNTSSSSSSDSI